MGIQILFILTLMGIVLVGFLFLQWVGGVKSRPTIISARDFQEQEKKAAEAQARESSDDVPPDSG